MLCGVDYVYLVLIIAVMAGLWWVAYRMEPHWASKDGSRMLCTVQELRDDGTTSRPKEARVLVTASGLIQITRKQAMRRRTINCTMVGKSPKPPRNLELYVVQERVDGKQLPDLIALRVPPKSRAIPVLERLVAEAELSASKPAQGSAAPADRPDQD